MNKRNNFVNNTEIRLNVHTIIANQGEDYRDASGGIRNFDLHLNESDDSTDILENQRFCFCYTDSTKAICRDVEVCIVYPADTIMLVRSHNCFKKLLLLNIVV